eukprot:12879892-Prorocentrum_lima.AAC.1
MTLFAASILIALKMRGLLQAPTIIQTLRIMLAMKIQGMHSTSPLLQAPTSIPKRPPGFTFPKQTDADATNYY